MFSCVVMKGVLWFSLAAVLMNVYIQVLVVEKMSLLAENLMS